MYFPELKFHSYPELLGRVRQPAQRFELVFLDGVPTLVRDTPFGCFEVPDAQVLVVDLLGLARAEVCELVCSCDRELDDDPRVHVSGCCYPEILADAEHLNGRPLWTPEERPHVHH